MFIFIKKLRTNFILYVISCLNIINLENYLFLMLKNFYFFLLKIK